MIINKGLITKKLGKKLVIFDGEKSVLYTFNETASYIFNLIKRKKTREEIINSLIKTYDVTMKQAKKDFNELISELKKKKIISFSKPK